MVKSFHNIISYKDNRPKLTASIICLPLKGKTYLEIHVGPYVVLTFKALFTNCDVFTLGCVVEM